MADTTEDVLELGPEIEIEEPEQTDGEAGEGDDEELVIGFGGEEAAPASGDDSSVIRDLRKANREMAKKLAAVDRANQPQIVDPGPEPDPNDPKFEWDTGLWKADWLKWKAESDRAAEQTQLKAQQDQALARKNQERVEAFKADKALLRVADFETAEEEVEAALPPAIMALVVRTGKAALLYGLAKNPEQLAALSKLDPSTELVEAAFMLGELKAKMKMETRRPQSPERKISGNAGFAPSTDKELARLEKEADRTGDRSALAAYRRKLRA